MSVYKRGDNDRKDGKKNDKKGVDKGLSDAGKSIQNFFSGLGGGKKNWDKKGDGHRLGGGSEGEAPPPRAARPPGAASRESAQQPRPMNPSMAAAAAAAEARAQKLTNPKGSRPARSNVSIQPPTRDAQPSSPRPVPQSPEQGALQAPPRPAAGGFDPMQAQFTTLQTARRMDDVEDAMQREAAQGSRLEHTYGNTGAVNGAATTPSGIDSIVAQLVEMGFEANAASEAAAACNGDLDVALEMLSPSGGTPYEGNYGEPQEPSASHGLSEEKVRAVDALQTVRSLEPGACRAVLNFVRKVLANVRGNPGEEKYRRLRRTNAKVAEMLAMAPETLVLLECAGFVPNADDEDAIVLMLSDADRCVLPPNLAFVLGEVDAALEDMGVTTPPLTLPRQGASLAATAAGEDRNALVLVAEEGSAANFDVPDEFFELDAAEAKVRGWEGWTHAVCAMPLTLIIPAAFPQALLAASAARREKEAVLRTKAQREADAQPARAAYKRGIIRVRFQGSYFLQGTFGAQETVGAVYDFVADALAEKR